MAKAKRGGMSYKRGYANYKTGNTESSNRLKKLTKLAKLQPNNLQITAAIKDIHRRRHTPKSPTWSHQDIALASLVKQFTGKFTKDWFSADPKIFAAAVNTRNEKTFKQFKDEQDKIKDKMSPHLMFKLKERAHDKWGNAVWK